MIVFSFFSLHALSILEWVPTHSHLLTANIMGFPGSSVVESTCQCRRRGFEPWVRKIPWRMGGSHSSILAWWNPMDRGAWRATVHRVIKVSDDLTAKQQQHIQYYQFSILFQCALSLSLHSTPNPLAILHMAQTYLYHVYVMFKEKSYKEEMDNFFFYF